MKFIDEIRASDKNTRRKWVFICSGVCIIILIFIWIGSLKVIKNNIENQTVAVSEPSPLSDFSPRLGRALRELGSRTSQALSNLKLLLEREPIKLEKTTTQ